MYIELNKLDFHLFAVDLNTNTTGQTGSNQDLSAEMKTFYDKALIKCAEPELVHDQFGQKRPIPKGSGKKIEFRKFSSLPKAMEALTEGVTPKGSKYNVSKIEASVEQYGAFIAVSDMLLLTAFDNNMKEIVTLLGSQAGRTSDSITRNVLVAGTNVLFAGAKASRATVEVADVLTVADIKKGVRALKAANAPRINGYYVAIVHPDTVYDLWNDTEWIEASKYAGSEQIFKGEIGKMYGVRFVESTEAKIWDKTAGSLKTNVYATLMLGANAFGVTSINGGGVETIAKQLGSGGTEDPLNQRATFGWKLNKTAAILTQEFMLRIEHAASISSAAN